MRMTVLLAAVAVVSLTACPEQKSAPASETTSQPLEAPAPSKPKVHAATPAGPEDAGTVAVAEDAGTTAEAKLEKFSGFSKDERQFAYSTYSDGAGFYLLQIVEGPTGEMKQRFVLDSPESETQARAALQGGGFTSAKGTLPEGVTVNAAVMDGKVRVTEQTANGAPKVLYTGNPFTQGSPASAKVDQVSPSGKRVAIRVEQKPVTEFGGIVTYLLLDVGGGK